MDDQALKIQLAGELKEILRIKRLNIDLMDALEDTVLFIVSRPGGLDATNLRRLQSLIARVRQLHDEVSPPQRKHRDRTPPESTVYTCVHCRVDHVSDSGVAFPVVKLSV